MISKWPTRWREQLLEELGIDVTQYALNVLSGWRRSTPLEPWTNNPTGLDAKTSARPAIQNTRYAMFPQMSDYRKSFLRLAETTPGKGVVALLTHGGTYTEAWNAIRALNTPGKHTEDEYPHVLLDMAGEAYEDDAVKRKKSRRKTTGVVNPTHRVYAETRAQNAALHHAAANIHDTAKAIEHIIRRLS